MPRRVGRNIKGPMITTGNPDTVNDVPVTLLTVGSAKDLTGQLGAIHRSNDGTKEWIYAEFSSTSTGKAPAANDICFWMSSTSTTLTSNWVVDNQTTAGTGLHVNAVAGLLRNACTRGNRVWLLRKAQNVNVAWNSTSTLDLRGDVVVALAAGNASVVSSTSTVSVVATLPLALAWAGGGANLGQVNVVTTSTIVLNINLDVS